MEENGTKSSTWRRRNRNPRSRRSRTKRRKDLRRKNDRPIFSLETNWTLFPAWRFWYTLHQNRICGFLTRFGECWKRACIICVILALEVFTLMRHINSCFTYLLTYLLNWYCSECSSAIIRMRWSESDSAVMSDGFGFGRVYKLSSNLKILPLSCPVESLSVFVTFGDACHVLYHKIEKETFISKTLIFPKLS